MAEQAPCSLQLQTVFFLPATFSKLQRAHPNLIKPIRAHAILWVLLSDFCGNCDHLVRRVAPAPNSPKFQILRRTTSGTFSLKVGGTLILEPLYFAQARGALHREEQKR